MMRQLAFTVLIIAASSWHVAALDTPRKQEQEPAGEEFERVLPTLEETLELLDKEENLPKRTWLWGEDQRSNRRRIDVLLDEAIESLGISGLNEARDQIHELEQQVRDTRRTISEYQRKRVSAPKHDSLGVVGKTLKTTREDYDKLISEEEANIAEWENEMTRLRGEFAGSLRGIGLELDEEAVAGLLASVTGDDVVSMAIVFDNVRRVTDQLQNLTEQSGEDLETAKRYYGMYVVLVEVLNHIQQSFIDQVKEDHVPALRKFEEQATKNIEEAQDLIRGGKGDEAVLRGNITANETTRRAAQLYVSYLEQQAQMVEAENEQVKKTLATARNTYATVKLSSDLATLMESGRQSFNTLMKLKLPYLREFKNDALRREFERMTEQLRGE